MIVWPNTHNTETCGKVFFFWNPTRQATTRSEQPNCLYEHNETYYLATWYVMANTNEDEKYDCFSAKSLKKGS